MINESLKNQLTIETKKYLDEWLEDMMDGKPNQAWVVQLDGVTLPMDPTPTEKGAHARIAYFFREPKYNATKKGFRYVTPEDQEATFKEWYKEHCKAVNLL